MAEPLKGTTASAFADLRKATRVLCVEMGAGLRDILKIIRWAMRRDG